MSLQFYKVLHLSGIFLVVMSLTGAILLSWHVGSKQFPQRKHLAMSHGLGLLVSLVAGFGLLARLGLAQGSLPLWAWAKLAIWLLVGLSTIVIYRLPRLGRVWFFTLFGLVVAASFFAVFKPL